MNTAEVDIWLMTESAGLRQTIQNILSGVGFQDVVMGDRVHDIESRLDYQSPDLLVCSAGLPGGDVGRTIERIRREERGKDPFFPIMIVDTLPEPKMVKRLVNSGPDDLLLQPLSVAHMTTRLDVLIETERTFLATHDYLGPARSTKRKAATGQMFEFEVPNSLRRKVTGRDDMVTLLEAKQSLREALTHLGQEKLEFLGDRLKWLLSVYDPHHVKDVDVRILEHVRQFQAVGEDLQPVLQRTSRAPVVRLSTLMANAADKVMNLRKDASRKDLVLVQLLGKALLKCLEAEDSDEIVNAFFATEQTAA